MKRFLFFLPLMLLAALVLVTTTLVDAQQPLRVTETPNVTVVVIPPPGDSPVDRILNDPGVVTPRPTATYPNIPAPRDLLTGTTAIVIDDPLNVRTLPNIRDGIVLLQLWRGDDVTVLQLTVDKQWALVDTRGPHFARGWVSAQFLRMQGEVVPFAATSEPDQAGTGLRLRAQETVAIRADPVILAPRVGLLPAYTEAEIIGRKSTYQWWKIRLADGTVGWVSAMYVYVLDPQAYQLAPVLVD
jgi:hypothetical protein